MDPRIARTRRAVLDTAADLLAEGGPTALTMDAVVARSGVAKSTMYRHWSTRDELVAEVFSECAPDVPDPDPDESFETGMRAVVTALARSLSDDKWRRLFPALILLANQQDELHHLDSDMKKRQHDLAEELLRRGVNEGHLVPSVLDDLGRSMALLVGPLVFSAITGTLTEAETLQLADVTVDQFLRAHRPDA